MLTRDLPLDPAQSALLFIDVQNFCCRRDGGEYAGLAAAEIEARFGWFFATFEGHVLPNMQRIRAAARAAGIEVMYTTIECLTADGRDRSLDYRITGFLIPKGHPDGRVIDALAPGPDEMWFPKSSSSVFISTHIDYVLRNLGIRQLVLAGLVTDQCVESAVRDACDLGYLVTLVTDACTTLSEDRHRASLGAIRGYCRQVTSAELLAELAPHAGRRRPSAQAAPATATTTSAEAAVATTATAGTSGE